MARDISRPATDQTELIFLDPRFEAIFNALNAYEQAQILELIYRATEYPKGEEAGAELLAVLEKMDGQLERN